jgi:hypothetical protein
MMHVDCTVGQKAIFGHLVWRLVRSVCIVQQTGRCLRCIFCSQSFGVARVEGG